MRSKTVVSKIKLEDYIKEEMRWLKETFLFETNYENIKFWKNSHAEDRYNLLKLRLKSKIVK